METSMSNSNDKLALIVGATGSFGAHAAMALDKHGWRIRGMVRDPARAAARFGRMTPIEWVEGDAMSAADVAATARGAKLIIHAANPPGYRNWKGLAVPMLEASIAAAAAEGARIVLPGTVYNFAPDAGPRIAEDAPQAPVTRKGAIRVEMERRLREASSRGVKVLILRAGDFFGPAAPNSAFAWLVRRRSGAVASVWAPGPLDVGHAFAYMPDLAETLAQLMDREEALADFDVFHFRGHWLERGDALAGAIRRVTGTAGLPLRRFPWAVVFGAAPFSETLRELIEMRYLWRRPIGLDSAKLVAFLGAEPSTPLDVAVEATLSDMGLLGGADRAPELAGPALAAV
jgi:nucleoside-diphosphate-sugar epimerase